MAFERYLAVCHPELVYAGQPRRRGNHQINSEQESKTIRKKVKKKFENQTISASEQSFERKKKKKKNGKKRRKGKGKKRRKIRTS